MTAEGSSVAGESAIIFQGNATANEGTITLSGAASATGMGGRLQFEGTSTAGNSTLSAKAGDVASAPGGRIIFAGQAQGGTARAVLEGGASLDISLSNSGMASGSVEGSGDVFLGSKNLAIGTNNLDSLFAGVLRDGGLVAGTLGSLTKTGSGKLTLYGDNLYSGATTVSGGTLCVAGSIAGDVMVGE